MAKPVLKKSKTPNLWLYRGGALLMALLLWAYVNVSQNPPQDEYIGVGVEMRNVPEDYMLMDSSYQVQLRVQGSSDAIRNLTSKDIVAYADLSGFEEGEFDVEVVVEEPLPNGIQLLRKPDTIRVRLARIGTKDFPLEVVVAGEPAQGYRASDPASDPSQIRLSGPQDYINQVDRVYVSASVADLTDNYDENLVIEVLDASGKLITDLFKINPATANVKIPILSDQSERILAVSVNRTGEPAPGYKFSHVTAIPGTVRVRGDMLELEKLDYISTKPVDITGFTKTTSVKVDLITPAGFELEFEQVTVSVEIEPADTMTFTKSLILTHNVPEGMVVEVTQQPVEIVVSGPATFMAGLTEDQVSAFIDCEGKEAGVHSLPVTVKLPDNITLVSVNPSLITVTLTEVASGDDGEAAGENGEAANPDEAPDEDSPDEELQL